MLIVINRSVVDLTKLNRFSLQRNEISVQVQVALLLYAAFKDHGNINVEVELPITKKGPAYHTDYVIMKEQLALSGTDASASTDASTSTDASISTDARGPTGILVCQQKIPVIVIEVKTVVPMEFEMMKASNSIEMLIYCLYLLRTWKLNSVIGCLTNGKVWHAIKVKRMDRELCIIDYMTFASTCIQVICV